MKYLILLFSVLLLQSAYSQENLDQFIALAKNTYSTYSGNFEIDENNPSEIPIETLLTNQKVYITVSAKPLNTSLLSVINATGSSKELPAPPAVEINDLDISFSEGVTQPCDGSDVTDVSSCATTKCTIIQRVIERCNQDNCWINTPEEDRLLSSITLMDSFKLKERVDISTCVPNNIPGGKHSVVFSVKNKSNLQLSGGSLTYSIMLQNDSL